MQRLLFLYVCSLTSVCISSRMQTPTQHGMAQLLQAASHHTLQTLVSYNDFHMHCSPISPVCLPNTRAPRSIITYILEKLNMTTIWPDTCLWTNETSYNEALGTEPWTIAYHCSPQLVSDTCIPCWRTSYGCGYAFDYSFWKDYFGCGSVAPWSREVPLRRRRSAAASAPMDGNRASTPTFPKASAASRAIEGYAGTFALPGNTVSAATGLFWTKHVIADQSIAQKCSSRGKELPRYNSPADTVLAFARHTGLLYRCTLLD
jgi:hypothetical protein